MRQKILEWAAFMVLGSYIPLAAQGFDSGSDGTDGALTLTTPGAILFDPASFTPPLDPDGDGIYHFTTITIGSNVTVRLRADIMGSKPVIWLANGAVDIASSAFLDLRGENGHAWSEPPIISTAGAGGFSGGIGRRLGISGTAGQGPGRGGYGAGGAGHVIMGDVGHTSAGSGFGGETYGNVFLMPLFGGSGGGGGAGSDNAAGGGAGGGAILIASSQSISLLGTIDVRGGADGHSAGSIVAFAGPGSSGSIRLMAPSISGNGNLRAQAINTKTSQGRIRVEAFDHSFNGSVQGDARFVSPGLVFPPAGSPKVQVTAIDGVPVPNNPQGNFNPADLTINEAGAVTIDVAAENIPVGTVVTLDIWTESTGNQTIQTTPLVGTTANSTASATATFPHGFSRINVQASWDPQ